MALTTLVAARSSASSVGEARVAMSEPSRSSGSTPGGSRPGRGRQVALDIDDAVVAAVGIDLAERLENAVGARWQLRIGEDGCPALPVDRLGDRRLCAGHHDRAQGGLDARFQTWTIMGRPAMSASGLFGRRVEARRAGTRTMVRDDCRQDGLGSPTSLSGSVRSLLGHRVGLTRGGPLSTDQTGRWGRAGAAGVLAATSEDRSPYGRVTRRQQDRGGNPDRWHHRAGCGGLIEDHLLPARAREDAFPIQVASATGEAAKPAPEKPLPVLLAAADPKSGERDAGVCKACHNFTEGAGTKIGPDL